jgi:hypothetical protein
VENNFCPVQILNSQLCETALRRRRIHRNRGWIETVEKEEEEKRKKVKKKEQGKGEGEEEWRKI